MLTATTEHALRALVHLVRLPPGESVLGRDLAERATIPANYLSKILLTLRNAGYVETTRGHGGGYRLAVPPQKIALIDIVELFEGIRARPGCFLGEKHECSDRNPCSAHAKWRSVKEVFLNYLASTTIADVAGPAIAEKEKRPRKKQAGSRP
jgi:Rrf2 family protein